MTMTDTTTEHTKITGRNIIAGQLSQAGTKTFKSVNPRTKAEHPWDFHEATLDDVNAAVEAAAAAFEEIRLYSAEKIAGLLDLIAEEIAALGDELVQISDSETALGRPRLPGEQARTSNQFRAFARLLREGSYVEAIIDTAQPERQPAPRPDIRRMLVPIGPVGVFTPNNFPLAFGIGGGDTASALAGGNPVIAKGHPSHPATSELVAGAITRAVQRAGFPAGTFSLLQGTSIEVGKALVEHPALRAVGFTGSLRGGRAIFDMAQARPMPIPVYAEMGSINPGVILPGIINAGAEALATKLVNSATLGSGQFCTNPGIHFVLKGAETDSFIATYARLMGEKAPGVLLNAGTEQSLERSVASTSAKSTVETLTGGHRVAADGFCYANTVLKTTGAAFINDPELQNEHFGPVTLFVVCDSTDELRAALGHLDGNLTATIHASDDELGASAAPIVEILREKAGRLLVNDVPTGVEVIYAQTHGGPYPATTMPGTTSVGMTAIKRFMRPVSYQNFPDALLPDALKRGNPLKIWRIIDAAMTQNAG